MCASSSSISALQPRPRRRRNERCCPGQPFGSPGQAKVCYDEQSKPLPSLGEELEIMPELPAEATEILKVDPRTLNRRFHENRRNFPEEQLAPYVGKMVAWWPDGSRIFDADANYHALFQRLRDAGYLVSFFVLEPIQPPNAEIDPYVALHMQFAENRDKCPAEELEKYGGKLVAWWPDGSRIFDVDTEGNGHAFFQRLDESGHDRSFFVYEVLPLFGESFV
jgi:hypothetical protein